MPGLAQAQTAAQEKKKGPHPVPAALAATSSTLEASS